MVGLHENAEITCALHETENLFAGLLGMSRSSGGEGRSLTIGAGGSSQAQLLEIVHDIEAKIPKDYDVDAALLKYPVLYTNSLNNFLIQEMVRFNRCKGPLEQSLGANNHLVHLI